jgi:hypothetical protein
MIKFILAAVVDRIENLPGRWSSSRNVTSATEQVVRGGRGRDPFIAAPLVRAGAQLIEPRYRVRRLGFEPPTAEQGRVHLRR